jgi:hypothetical protein
MRPGRVFGPTGADVSHGFSTEGAVSVRARGQTPGPVRRAQYEGEEPSTEGSAGRVRVFLCRELLRPGEDGLEVALLDREGPFDQAAELGVLRLLVERL